MIRSPMNRRRETYVGRHRAPAPEARSSAVGVLLRDLVRALTEGPPRPLVATA